MAPLNRAHLCGMLEFPNLDASATLSKEPTRSQLGPVSYTHLRAHETDSYLVCRLLLEKKILIRYPLIGISSR